MGKKKRPKGTEKLAAWMLEEDLTHVALAERVKTARTTVLGWLSGRRPAVEHAIALHEVSKGHVSVFDWK